MQDISSIKYLGIDLDGTLLTSSKQIDNETCAFLKDLSSEGYIILLITGRHFREIIPFINVLSLDDESIVITCDGEYIYKCDNSLLWSSKRLNGSDVIDICNLIDCEHTSIITDTQDYRLDYTVIGKVKYHINRFLGRSHDVFISRVDKVRELKNIEKIVLPLQYKDVIHRIQSLGRYEVHILDEGRIEILPSGVNKYTALKEVEALGRVSLSKLLYIGNDFNDLECFNNLAYCVAMGDAPLELKSQAVYVTTTCNENGVLKALKKVLNR